MSLQRELVLVMVGIALVAITLVGAGVLAFARLGARAEATQAVDDQLVALQELAASSDGRTLATLEPAIRRLGAAFGDGQLAVVIVNDNGTVRALPNPPQRQLAPVDGTASVTITPEELASLRADDVVIVQQPRNVVGMVRLDIPIRPGVLDGTPVLWVRHGVGTVSSRATRWFLASATIVVLASAVAATVLARRITEPIHAIERATAAIAAGRLDTRIDEPGDDELGELASSVNSMAGDLERSRAAEQQFLMSITHDLRTPLTAITGWAEALSDGAVDDPRRAGEIIGSNAGRLDRLVADLLTLAKLEAKSFSFDLGTVDVVSLASEQVAHAEPRAATHGLHLGVDPGASTAAWVVADADRLRQVVDNLIDNAVKFAASTITITVSGATPEAPGVEMSVVDDGPGIPDSDLPYVFERLYVTQLRPVRAENSSGLGLAIVRELVEGMGGSVIARRAATGGTEIALSLPAAPAPRR